MSAHVVPVDRLSPEALQGAIEEFISREGTNYGEIEVLPETSFRQEKDRLEKGFGVLVCDDETEATTILSSDDPMLRRIKASTE